MTDPFQASAGETRGHGPRPVLYTYAAPAITARLLRWPRRARRRVSCTTIGLRPICERRSSQCFQGASAMRLAGLLSEASMVMSVGKGVCRARASEATSAQLLPI